MKQISSPKNRFDNTDEEESFIDLNTEKERGKNKIFLSKIKKSYSTLTNENINHKLLYKNEEENLGLNERIDYAKQIKQAKEIEDLRKIYEKWSGERLDWNKRRSLLDDDYYFLQRKNRKIDYSSTEGKIPKYNPNDNSRYNNLYIYYKKINFELNNNKEKNKLKKTNENNNDKSNNKEKDKLKKINENDDDKNNKNKLKNKNEDNKQTKTLIFSKPKIKINLKSVIKRNLSNNKNNELNNNIKDKDKDKDKDENKNKNKYKYLENKKINNNEGDFSKNKYLLFSNSKNEKKDSENINENDIKNKKIEDNKKQEKKKIIVFNMKKFIKEDNSETNDESVSDKLRIKNKFELNKKLIGEKININDDEKRKNSYEKNQRNKITLKLKTNNSINKTNIYNKKKGNNDLNDIIKKGIYLFSDIYNILDNLPEKLDFILEVDKYIKKEIKINKDENLISPEKAVYYVDNIIIRFLGYFGSELKLRNCNTYIEKKPTKYSLREIIFKIIASGLATQKIYKLYLDNDEYKTKFEDNEEEWINFLDDIKAKISNKFNVLDEDIYFFGNNLNNFETNLLIYDKKILGIEDFLKNNKLKVRSCNLLNNIILSPNIFETEFCKDVNGWPKKNLMRGGKNYNPPYGWYGISLRVQKKYGKSNKWLGKENIEGEWPVAYHGVGKGNIFNKIVNIINGNLKDEEGRIYKYEYNTEKNKNKYPFCGEGVYLSPKIEDAAKFTDKTSLGIFNIKFQFVFMTRVNPSKIRSPGGFPIQWILSGNSDEIRPYRLLFKLTSI